MARLFASSRLSLWENFVIHSDSASINITCERVVHSSGEKLHATGEVILTTAVPAGAALHCTGSGKSSYRPRRVLAKQACMSNTLLSLFCTMSLLPVLFNRVFYSTLGSRVD